MLKAEDGTVVEEILGNGFKTQTKECELEDGQVLVGFYGTINGAGQAVQSLGLIVYNQKHCVLD